MSDQIRYTSYTVFKKIAGLNDEGTVTAELVAEDLQKTVAAIEGSGVQVLGLYDVSVFRAEDDLMVWFASEKPEGLQEALRLLEGSIAGTFLERVWSAAGVHRLAEFTRSHIPSFMDPKRSRQEWITVYPFVRSYEWYLLEDEERREMLREHGELGRDYPNVNANTVAAFALGDYEWLLSFESDDLHELVDMMRHLRYSKARLHVRDELPFHTGRRISIEDTAEVLL